LAVGLLNTAFIILRYISSIPSLFRDFIINSCWILSRAFFASKEMIMWFLYFFLFIFCDMFDLYMVNHPYIPGMKPTWSWHMIFFMCVEFALQYFIDNFCVYINQGN
jgi:hypothetical protein